MNPEKEIYIKKACEEKALSLIRLSRLVFRRVMYTVRQGILFIYAVFIPEIQVRQNGSGY